MIAEPRELKAFLAMKIRVFALFGAVAMASFMLLSAPQALAVLMDSIGRLPPFGQALLRTGCLMMPVAAAIVLSVRQRRRAQARAARR